MGSTQSLPLDNHALNSMRRNLSQTDTRDKSVVEYPPLIVVKDSSCQTSVTYPVRCEPWFRNHTIQWWAYTVIVFLISMIIFALFSKSCQSFFIYMNAFNYPFGNLKDLNRFGLHDARNIRIEASDGTILHGWHILPPGHDATHSAKLAEKDKDDFFDSCLRNASTVVVYFHGNAGNRGLSRRVSIVRRLSSQLGAHAIALDYRGFGDSSGWPSEEGTALDARALWYWLESVLFMGKCGTSHIMSSCVVNMTHPFPKVFLYGHSLGSAIATKLAAELSFRQFDSEGCRCSNMSSLEKSDPAALHHINSSCGSYKTHPCTSDDGCVGTDSCQYGGHCGGIVLSGLVLDSPFSSLADAVMDFPYVAPLRIIPYFVPALQHMLQFKYHTASRLPDVSCPVLLMHGLKDTVLSYAHSNRLLEAVVHGWATRSRNRHLSSEREYSRSEELACENRSRTRGDGFEGVVCICVDHVTDSGSIATSSMHTASRVYKARDSGASCCGYRGGGADDKDECVHVTDTSSDQYHSKEGPNAADQKTTDSKVVCERCMGGRNGDERRGETSYKVSYVKIPHAGHEEVFESNEWLVAVSVFVEHGVL